MTSIVVELNYLHAHLLPNRSQLVGWKTLHHPVSTLSAVEWYRTKWYRTSICFEALWCIGFFANATTPWLSLDTTVARFGSACRNVQASRPSQSAFLAASDATTYSASVVDVVVNSWNFDHHEIASCPFGRDIRMSTFSRQDSWLGPKWMLKPCVPTRYLKICFTIV